MQISSNNNAAFIPAPAPAAEAQPAPAAQPGPQNNAGAQLRAMAQAPLVAQAAQYDASVATGSDTVGQEPRQLTRQNDPNGRGSQGGADSQPGGGQSSHPGPSTADTRKALTQASIAALGPSGGGASVGPGPASSPFNRVFTGGPAVVAVRPPASASVGPGPAEASAGGRWLASLPAIAPLPARAVLDPSAPPGAVAKFDGEWLDKDGNMIATPGRIGVMRHPQPGEKDYALFKQLTDPHGTRDGGNRPQAAVPMPKLPASFDVPTQPATAVTGPQAAVPMPKLPASFDVPTQPATAVTGPQAVAPVQGAGSASKSEVQALELMLADPDSQAMVAEFGGPLKPVPQGTKVAEGIVARYGEDLGARLYQYQNAVRGVENAYAKSLDEALKNPGPNVPGSFAVKGDLGNGVPDSWQVDPVAFTRAYAAGDSTAQRAFANIHGADPLKLVKQGNEETGNPDKLMLNGRELTLGRPNVTDGGNVDGWIAGKVERHYTQLDPARITKLHNPEMLWFDPQQGFVTHPDNIKDSLESKIVLGAMMAVATFGVGVATAGLGTLASSTVTAGLSSAMGQGLATGEINGKAVFKSMLTSVVTGALGNSANSLASTSGLTEMAKSGDFWDRLGAGLIQAGGKGLASQLTGGSFASGAAGSLLNSAGAEITRQLGTQIESMFKAGELNSTQASALRMTAKAVGAAITQLRSGGNSAMTAMAQEYLRGVGDELGLNLPAGLLKP